MSQEKYAYRNELIEDIVTLLKHPIEVAILHLWEKIYKNQEIPRTKWLQQYQLSLKQFRDLNDDDILQKLSHKRHLAKKLEDVLSITAQLADVVIPASSDNRALLALFTRNVLLQVGRELWSKPYVVYNITHNKKLVVEAKEVLQTIISDSINFEIRKMVDDMVSIENERLAALRPYVSETISEYQEIAKQENEQVPDTLAIQRTPSLSSISSVKSLDKQDDVASVKSIQLNMTPSSDINEDLTSTDNVLNYIPIVDDEPLVPQAKPQDIKTIDVHDAQIKPTEIIQHDGKDLVGPVKINKLHKHPKKRPTALEKYSNYRDHHAIASSRLLENKAATFF
jgi:hypothetical protein